MQHNMTKEKRVTGGWGCYANPMKRAVVDNEGIMRLGYWEGNEAMKAEKGVKHRDVSRVAAAAGLVEGIQLHLAVMEID